MSNTGNFFAIEKEMQRRKEQREKFSKLGEMPFRVEFRYRGGSKAWEYYPSYEEAENAEAQVKCRYNIYGSAVIERPSSRQLQVKGPRGGWRKYAERKQ